MNITGHQNSWLPAMIITIASVTSFPKDTQAGSINNPILEKKVVAPNNYEILSALSPEEAILARTEQYEKVMKEGATKGFILGFANGAVIGGGLSGDAGGLIIGGLLGGLLGRYIAEGTSASLVLEHQNYLVHRQSIEDILKSAQRDRANTSFDLYISQAYMSEVIQSNSGKADEDVLEGVKLFRQNAVARMLTLQEIAPTYIDTEKKRANFEFEISAQRDMIKTFSRLIEVLK